MRKAINEYGRIVLIGIIFLILAAFLFGNSWSKPFGKVVNNMNPDKPIIEKINRNAPVIYAGNHTINIKTTTSIADWYKAYDDDNKDITKYVTIKANENNFYDGDNKTVYSDKEGEFQLSLTVKDPSNENLITKKTITVIADANAKNYPYSLAIKNSYGGKFNLNKYSAYPNEQIKISQQKNEGYYYNGCTLLIDNTNKKNLSRYTYDFVMPKANVLVIPEWKKRILTNLEITNPPDITRYELGTKFDKTGMEVTAIYDNGDREVISNYTYAPTNELSLEQKNILVSYTEAGVTKTASQPIEVVKKELTEIKITKAPNKVDYIETQKFDKTGMEVTAYYTIGDPKIITDYSYTPASELKMDDNYITVSYTENDITKTAQQAITVEKRVITDIKITKPPSKTEYAYKEKFDKTGMEVTVYYNTGDSKVITDYTYSPANELDENDDKITISYTEDEITKTTNQPITVITPIMETGSNFQSHLNSYKSDIQNVYFKKQADCYLKPGSLIYSCDVSEKQNKSVMAYVVREQTDSTKYDLYLVGNMGVILNKDSSSLFNNFSSAGLIDFGNDIDTTRLEIADSMFYNCESLLSLDLTKFNTPKLNNTSLMFAECSSLSNISLGDNFNTINVTNMEQMFDDCASLSSLTFNDNFSTENVKDFKQMFNNCASLTSLNFNNSFVTTSATNMSGMFQMCSKLNTLNLDGHFNTNNVNDMGHMFAYCSNLTNIQLGENFSTSKVKDMSYMFAGCKSLGTILFKDKFDTSCCENMDSMFRDCEGLQTLDLGNLFDTVKVSNMSMMFSNCSSLSTLELGDNFNTSGVQDMKNMFYNCASLEIINFKNKFNTSNCRNMSEMFAYCNSLKSLNIKFNTLNVTNMDLMFYYCTNLQSLDLGNSFVTSNCLTMNEMFSNCCSLTELNLGAHFNTEKIQNMNQLFFNCSSLTYLNLGDLFDTSNVKYMFGMFQNCQSIKYIDLNSKFNTQNVSIMDSMFERCVNLKTLDLGNNFNTKKVTDFSNMFRRDERLESLNLGANFSTDSATRADLMFYGTKRLTNIDLTGVNKVFNNMFAGWRSNQFIYCLDKNNDTEFTYKEDGWFGEGNVIYKTDGLTSYLRNVTLSKAPNKTAYIEGQAFDATGIEIIGTFSDGQSKVLTDYVFTPSGNLNKNNDSVLCSIREGVVIKTIVIPISVVG